VVGEIHAQDSGDSPGMPLWLPRLPCHIAAADADPVHESKLDLKFQGGPYLPSGVPKPRKPLPHGAPTDCLPSHFLWPFTEPSAALTLLRAWPMEKSKERRIRTEQTCNVLI